MWGTNKKKSGEFKKLEKTKITEKSEKVDGRIKEKEINVKKEKKQQFKKLFKFFRRKCEIPKEIHLFDKIFYAKTC